VLADQGEFEEAVEAYRQALAIKPDHNVACINLGCLFNLHGRLDEAVDVYRKFLALDPADAVVHSNLLLCLNYHPQLRPEELYREHVHWDLQHGRPGSAKAVSFPNTPLPDRVLRIGYLSPDLGQHPVGFFLASVLPTHDRERFHITCYSCRSVEDDYTVRLRESSDRWRAVKGVDDDSLATMIREDEIDILIDLSGHTNGNRLTMFAQKPAPVQMTWAGYVGTTGLGAIDYLISDRIESPQGAERFCSEKILRLPNGYLCYQPPAYAPEVAALPLLGNGFVTFGSFNNTAKVNREVVALWARLLREMPSARLVLKYKGYEHPEVQGRYLAMFAEEGIEAGRIDLSGAVPHHQLLQCYNGIDIALDPFPYSGGLTTMEALWMGVPVITLGGERFCSRHSMSHLTNVGVTELIADEEDGYIRIARQLAEEPKRLQALRASLRERMASSPLCDGAGFTRDLEGAFREAWRDWCDQPKPA
jgi:protein O-GlcNAc transferase